MKRALYSALVCLMSIPVASATESTSTEGNGRLEVSLEVSSARAATGDMIGYRVRLTNRGKEPVQVPTDTMKFVRLEGEYAPPGVKLSASVKENGPVDKVRARTTWRTLEAGASLESKGTFKSVFPECVTGCRSGAYRLNVLLDVPKNSELKLGQIVPGFSRAHVQALVEPKRHAVPTDGVELTLSNPMWRSPRQLDFQGTIRNNTNRPVWIPNPEQFLMRCKLRVVTPHQTIFMNQDRRKVIPVRFNERDGILLHGGDETYFNYQCRGIQEREILRAKKIHLAAELKLEREFYPLEYVEHSNYLKGRLRSSQVKVK
jgi:hypothetical protein